MKVSAISGFLDMVYSPPNNWEKTFRDKVVLNLIWPEKDIWKSKCISDLNLGESLRVSTDDFPEIFDFSTLAVVYPSDEKMPAEFDLLPSKPFWTSEIPQWRCTSGFNNGRSQVTYQSEVFPLPEKGSLLSFHPFIQYGNVTNKLIVLNLQKTPGFFEHELHIFDSKTFEMFGSAKVKTNSISEIDLDQFAIPPDVLPVMASSQMAGIPFGLGISNDGKMMSLEHTHPPASFVLAGNRFKIQSEIKRKWFTSLYENL